MKSDLQDMKTAPRDGTAFVGWCEERGFQETYFCVHYGDFISYTEEFEEKSRSTYWKPFGSGKEPSWAI